MKAHIACDSRCACWLRPRSRPWRRPATTAHSEAGADQARQHPRHHAGRPSRTIGMRRAPTNGTQRIFKCKPLACPDPQTVVVHLLQKPDPASRSQGAGAICQGRSAQEHPRRQRRPRGHVRRRRRRSETLISETATLKGYPSVINETKLSRDKSETYVETAIIFAGALMIRVQSSSPNRELAQEGAGSSSSTVMRIEEGPPAPPTPVRRRSEEAFDGTPP